MKYKKATIFDLLLDKTFSWKISVMFGGPFTVVNIKIHTPSRGFPYGKVFKEISVMGSIDILF